MMVRGRKILVKFNVKIHLVTCCTLHIQWLDTFINLILNHVHMHYLAEALIETHRRFSFIRRLLQRTQIDQNILSIVHILWSKLEATCSARPSEVRCTSSGFAFSAGEDCGTPSVPATTTNLRSDNSHTERKSLAMDYILRSASL